MALLAEPLTEDAMAPLFRSRQLLRIYVAERRVLRGQPPLSADSGQRMLRDSFANLLAPGPESIWLRVGISGWRITTMVAPSPLARWLIRRKVTSAHPKQSELRP